MSGSSARGPVALVILDGWGNGRVEPGNAVLAANTPVMDRLLADYPHTTLLTSGLAVGLPEGQMGNSEVGHLNLGAGFIVYQWITRIDKAIADGEFARNPALVRAMDSCVARGSALHLMGLVSDGGVHSHTRHLLALLALARQRNVPRVYVHAFTDGRDTGPRSGQQYLIDLQDWMERAGVGRIVTVSGRYYAMDRDKRWERVQLAWDAVVNGVGPQFTSVAAAIEAAYVADVTDEFIVPCCIVPPGTEPVTMEPGDEAIFFNFRSDRGRQLTEALASSAFEGFPRSRDLTATVPVTTLTRYEEGLPVTVAFEPQDVVNPIARVVSEAGLKQFHSAETEKYAHVTFFFNGGREEPFPGEVRALVPSPRVATYDLAPEMSAAGVTDAVVGAIRSGQYGFIIVNFANGDMVGHTGSVTAATEAIETVDRCLGKIIAALEEAGGRAIITADHGNAEEMIDRVTGGPMTAHTTNPVPLVLFSAAADPLREAKLRPDGILSSVTPTLLEMMGIPAPADMTTPSLIVP